MQLLTLFVSSIASLFTCPGMEGPQTPEELEKKLQELENLESQAGNNDSSSNGGGQQNMPYGYGFPGNNGTPGANNGGGGWNC